MTLEETVSYLKSEIDMCLAPLVDRDYRLLEIPDYANIGDVLIFEGERTFLKTIPHRCLGMSTMFSFGRRLPDIRENELLIFSGGGYFGDLWPVGPRFQAKVLERYPRNPMLIFPQSVCFLKQSSLDAAIARYGAHKNLVICLRDRYSYEFVKRHFRNEARLVPDIAFYADISRWRSQNAAPKGTLLLKRCDKELKMSPALDAVSSRCDVDVLDWPTISSDSWLDELLVAMRRHPRRSVLFYDWTVKNLYRPFQMKAGVRFIERYSEVVSTRIHGGILAFLLGKKVEFLDNSYGKIRGLYETWLSGCDNVRLLDDE